MIALVAALALAPHETITLLPTDDVWVYPHAQDQSSDPFLRVWGGSEGAVGFIDQGEFTFSYSCLRFELPEGFDASKIESARLVLHSIPTVSWTAKDSEDNPIEARKLDRDFTEKAWEFSKSATVIPKAGDEQIFGTGKGEPAGGEKPIPFYVDLLKGKGDFKAYLGANRIVRLALTTKMAPEDMGEGRLYKFYSRQTEDEKLKPRLEIVVD